MSEFKCRQCNNDYPNQDNFFTKSNRYKSGFDTLCKICKSSKDKEYRENNSQDISDRRKIKYNNEIKPISHDIYVDQMRSDPILWRAKILRQGMQQRSVINNLEFDEIYFTVENIKEIISKQTLCPCCKVLFDYESLLNGTKNNASPSADRFNNSKGYIKDNVVIICWRCNNLKRDTSIEELKTVINWLEGKYENN